MGGTLSYIQGGGGPFGVKKGRFWGLFRVYRDLGSKKVIFRVKKGRFLGFLRVFKVLGSKKVVF